MSNLPGMAGFVDGEDRSTCAPFEATEKIHGAPEAETQHINTYESIWDKETPYPGPKEEPFDPFEALRAMGDVTLPEPIELPVVDDKAEATPMEIGESSIVTREQVPDGINRDDLGDAVVVHRLAAKPAEARELSAGGNPKDAIGLTKPSLTAIPSAALLFESQAMMDGARKYGPYNWRKNPVLMRVYLDAALRHIQQILDGEDVDPISGCYHVGHARACLGIIADAMATGNLLDDRPLPGAAGELIRRFGDTQTFIADQQSGE